MTTEWKYLQTFQDVACAQADGWEIECAPTDCDWRPWAVKVWQNNWGFRARPRQPVMKKVKMLCYFDTVIYQLVWSSAEAISGDWIRVPSEDKTVEVPA
jgi:hypothetical protein